MKYFYRIVDGKLQRGSGFKIPTGFLEYTKGQEPQEMSDALTKEDLLRRPEAISKAIQKHLDKQAQALRYDNMMSARSYAGYTNPFQAEAQKLAEWCANCWAKAGEIEADVEAGNRPMPTVDEVLAELPVYGA